MGEYVGGPCPDPQRCRYWLRYAEGPWTCESNHPRVMSDEHNEKEGKDRAETARP